MSTLIGLGQTAMQVLLRLEPLHNSHGSLHRDPWLSQPQKDLYRHEAVPVTIFDALVHRHCLCRLEAHTQPACKVLRRGLEGQAACVRLTRELNRPAKAVSLGRCWVHGMTYPHSSRR